MNSAHGLFLSLMLGCACATHAAEAPSAVWPERTVAIEELEALTPFRLQAPRLPAMGAVRGPSTLRARVDGAGSVTDVVLIESCGNPSLDEAALHALRTMKFKPYAAAGVPVDVTLVLPVRFPTQWGRARQGR